MSIRTRQSLSDLIEGRISSPDGPAELVRIATRLIVAEALEAESRVAVGRECHEHGGNTLGLSQQVSHGAAEDDGRAHRVARSLFGTYRCAVNLDAGGGSHLSHCSRLASGLASGRRVYASLSCDALKDEATHGIGRVSDYRHEARQQQDRPINLRR